MFFKKRTNAQIRVHPKWPYLLENLAKLGSYSDTRPKNVTLVEI